MVEAHEGAGSRGCRGPGHGDRGCAARAWRSTWCWTALPPSSTSASRPMTWWCWTGTCPAVHGDEICRKLAARPVGQPGADADGGQHGQGPRGGSGPRRRRLPDQALRLRRARRANPCHRPPAGAPRCRQCSSTAMTLDPAAGSRSGRGRRLDLSPEGVRAAGVPARRGRPCGLGRGTAGASLGRGGRPLHHRGQADDAPAAAKLGDPPYHPHRPRGRLPDRRS